MNEESRLGWGVMLVSGLLCMAGAVGARAQGVPLEMNYQGVLAMPNGQPVAGDNLTVDFRIFDAERGGTMIWGERQLVTTDSNGVFDVLIGDAGEDVPGPATNQVNSLPEVFSGVNADQRWLEVEVVYNLTAAMSPRQRFATVPYAYQAGNAAGSRGDFVVGSVLSVTSNAYLQGSLNLTDTGQEVLVFNDNVLSTAGLIVSQKMVVAVVTSMVVKGTFAVQGNAIFSNDTTFTQSAEFDGLAYFTNGVSLRGNTAAFGSFRQLAAKGPDGSTHSDTGTIQTNGFLIVRMITSSGNSGGNTMTFTLNGQQVQFRADWGTDGIDSLHYQDSAMFPVEANSTWTVSGGNGSVGYVILYRSIP